MAIKTNKAYKKRLRLTKSGKVLARKSGHDHFNAKERRIRQLKKKRMISIALKPKARSRFLVNI